MREPDFDAIVVEGGAMRGIFAAGVLDAFMENSFDPFSMLVGVSAGATNLLGFFAKTPYRSKDVICNIATAKQFISPLRFMRGGHLCDVQWLWQQSLERYPIQQHTLPFHARPFYVVTTDILSGQAGYHRVNTNNMDAVFEASCALPLFYKKYPKVDNVPMTDGGIADSIPVQFAYKEGARRILVIRSQPVDYRKQTLKFPWLVERAFAEYPGLIKASKRRAQNYNESCEFTLNPPADCHIEIIAPPPEFRVKRFSKSKALLAEGYQVGKNAGYNWLTQNS